MSKKEESSGVWDNEQFKAAWDALPEKQKEEYKKAGEYMYNNIDYTQNFNNVLQDSAFYIIEGVKSGLHPKDLEDNEKKILTEVYGENWYVKYGYEKKDLE